MSPCLLAALDVYIVKEMWSSKTVPILINQIESLKNFIKDNFFCSKELKKLTRTQEEKMKQSVLFPIFIIVHSNYLIVGN